MPRTRSGKERLLLDTHVWIWVMEGEESELSKSTIRVIEDAGGGAGLLVSAISVWEVGMLEAKRRISLSRAVDEWVQAALTAPGHRLVELTPEIALESTRLPPTLHGDPADRIIVATARFLGATLVTCDESILKYAKTGHLRVRDGRK
jgi:PIN domain nuclease of toxin-antitoxin system